VLIVVALLIAWEAAKLIGGDPWRVDGTLIHNPPLRWRFASDQSLPHVWEVFSTLAIPIQPNRPALAFLLIDYMVFTMKGAAMGFAVGSAFGLLLGIVLSSVRILERALVPYVVASQTIPIIAVAPVLVYGMKTTPDVTITAVAAYLTFFPVTIAALRGLRSADPRAIELMRSLAAGRWTVLWKVRLPAAAPYLFTAFKISATAAVVGAIVGELPSGVRVGLGGALQTFNQYYTIAPERLWAALLYAAAAGIIAFLLVVAAERFALRGYRPSEEPA
jgi:NitT/TauT family transport system permease protein